MSAIYVYVVETGTDYEGSQVEGISATLGGARGIVQGLGIDPKLLQRTQPGAWFARRPAGVYADDVSITRTEVLP